MHGTITRESETDSLCKPPVSLLHHAVHTLTASVYYLEQSYWQLGSGYHQPSRLKLREGAGLVTSVYNRQLTDGFHRYVVTSARSIGITFLHSSYLLI
jgi:hypothetical protein